MPLVGRRAADDGEDHSPDHGANDRAGEDAELGGIDDVGVGKGGLGDEQRR